MPDDGLHCWVYRSPRIQEMYLYLAQEGGFDRVPEALLARFGDPHLVIELELDPGRRLARADVTSVIRNLRNLGYHLQLPPRLEPTLYRGNQD